MSAVADVFHAGSALELVRVAGMEIAIACFAATIYFTFSGWMTPLGKKPDPSGKLDNKTLRGVKSATHDMESSACQLINKTLRQGKIRDAIDLLRSHPKVATGNVPANVAPRLLMAAAKASDFDNVMIQMQEFVGKFEPRSLEAVVTEALKNRDVDACRKLHLMSGLLSLSKSQQTFAALAQAYSSDVAELRTLVEESKTPLPRHFAKVVLEACTALKEVDLAAEVFEKVTESDATALRKIVEKAATNASGTSGSDTLTKESTTHAKEIRSCGKNGDLPAALGLFEQQRSNGVSSTLYNGILDACVSCGDLEKALDIFSQAKKDGLADVVSYNMLIKGHVAQGDGKAAKALLLELSSCGLRPTHASYHTILNFHSSAGDRAAAWSLLEEMQAGGLPPSTITCAILLKGKLNLPSDVDRVLSVMGKLNDPMDEVLFSALAEACIRTKKLDELSRQMSKFSSQSSSAVLSAPTYGSMIKAFGRFQDVKRVKELWDDMVKHDVKPTAITLGCMVEALVMNKCTADAWALAQQLRSDESTEPLVNTVIYSTILKGFANAKETDKVMALYGEMQARKIQPNTITYNTILNAFAQGGGMDRVPALLEDMKAAVPPAEPDIVTYSTIVKGFCNTGNLDRALSILKTMQDDGKYSPDEVMYNSLLDGCFKEQRPDDALKLLDDMKKSGVAPSNYTLSMLVKLMGRCRRLKQAFSLIEELSREYSLKINIQVYTCLIQASFNNRQPAKAVALLDQIIADGLYPDEMTYSVLVKGCLQASLVDKAAHVVKCAYGVALPKAHGKPPGVNARSLGDVVAALGGAKSTHAQSLLAEIGQGEAVSDDAVHGNRHGKPVAKKGGNTLPPWRQQKA